VIASGYGRGPALLRANKSKSLFSRVWLTPDLSLGFHHFDYSIYEYDGLSHRHGVYCIVMGLAGAIEIVRDTQTDRVESGEILVVNPGELHRCRFGMQDSRSEDLTLILRPHLLRNVLEAMSLPYTQAHDLHFRGKIRDADVFRLAGELIHEVEEQRRGYAIVAEGLIRQVLVHLFRVWPSEATAPGRLSLPPQLPWLHMHRAMEYMNAHGKGAFRLWELCSDVGVSPSRFITLFKNSAGTSPHTYYNGLLIYKTRHLLQVGRCSTKDAAYTLGFKNVSHFCALFHQLTDATPQSDQPTVDLLPQSDLPDQKSIAFPSPKSIRRDAGCRDSMPGRFRSRSGCVSSDQAPSITRFYTFGCKMVKNMLHTAAQCSHNKCSISGNLAGGALTRRHKEVVFESCALARPSCAFNWAVSRLRIFGRCRSLRSRPRRTTDFVE
jgi:AraC-like DNA-binding protein